MPPAQGVALSVAGQIHMHSRQVGQHWRTASIVSAKRLEQNISAEVLTSINPESKKLITQGRGVLIMQLKILSHTQKNLISLSWSTTKMLLPGMMIAI